MAKIGITDQRVCLKLDSLVWFLGGTAPPYLAPPLFSFISRRVRNCFLFFVFFKFYFIYLFIRQVLISHQFYTHQCIHVNPNLPIHPTTTTLPLPLSPLGVHTFVLYICVSISALQTGSSVPFFLGSTCMR